MDSGLKESVQTAVGKKLSPRALIKEILMTPKQTLKRANVRIKRMEDVKEYTKSVNLKADIRMVHGNKMIASNKVSFADMSEKYSKWVKQQGEQS